MNNTELATHITLTCDRFCRTWTNSTFIPGRRQSIQLAHKPLDHSQTTDWMVHLKPQVLHFTGITKLYATMFGRKYQL